MTKTKLIKNKITILTLFILGMFLFPVLVEARSGCCSWHGGVCSYSCPDGKELGYKCCDGTSLSTTCAPYYSKCENVVSEAREEIEVPKELLTDIPSIPEENPKELPQYEPPISNMSTIKIASWNLDTFGIKKASDNKLMQTYVSIIDDYDIIFIQEIRDKSGKSFQELCNSLPDYNCQISSRAGRSIFYKEQYGIIYKKNIALINFTDYNPDKQNRWERPPVMVLFNISGYMLTAYNIHTKPSLSDVKRELSYLENLATNFGNVIVLGDMNADCMYYHRGNEFASWNWVIKDYEDTTVSSTRCAYDRIIMNNNAYQEYLLNGIYKQIDAKLSDHYLVWVEVKPKDDLLR